jgi:hypothetical protein
VGLLRFKEEAMRVRHWFLGLLAIGVISGQACAQSLELTSFPFRRPLPCDSGAAAANPLTGMPADPSRKDDIVQPRHVR